MTRLLQHPVWASLALLALITGGLYILQAGKAEQLVNFRTMLLLPIIAGHLAVLIGLVKTVASRVRSYGFMIFALCLILQDVLIASTVRIDAIKIEESKQRAEAIFDSVQAFREANHRLPTDLNELKGIPEPAVQNSTFLYQTEQTDYTVSFKAPSSHCTWSSNVGQWKCD